MSKVIEIVKSEVVEWEEERAKCDKCGVIELNDLSEKECMDGGCDGRMKHEVIECRETIQGHVIVKCDCGKEVACGGFTSTCDCGADYNWNGTRLADRSCWGEETGETASDTLAEAW